MTIKELLRWGHEALFTTSQTARLDAELLLAHVLKRPVTFLLAHDEQKISSLKRWWYQRLIRKRQQGMPVAYMTGHKEFYGLDFKVNRHTLIPRPDTEILVEKVLDFLNDQCPNSNVQTKSNLLVDVGTGSGCIPIAILKQFSDLQAVAIDVSSSALRVAKANAQTHHVLSRLTLLKSDLLSNFDARKVGDCELVITANLPYIPPGFPMTPDTGFEPELALYANDEGVELYKKLVQQMIPLKPVAVFFECFDFQAAILSHAMPGYRMEMVDMSGRARVVAFYLT